MELASVNLILRERCTNFVLITNNWIDELVVHLKIVGLRMVIVSSKTRLSVEWGTDDDEKPAAQ
jgi:hypothetical protein